MNPRKNNWPGGVSLADRLKVHDQKVCRLKESPGAQFLCSLKSHHVEGNAPRGGLMSGRVIDEKGRLRDAVINAIDDVVGRGGVRNAGYENFGNAEADSENAILDSSRLSKRFPRWIRSNLSVPRCVNSVSLFIFMLFDILVWIVALKLLRFYVRSVWGLIPADKPTDSPEQLEEKLSWRSKRWWFLFVSSTAITIGICTGVFSLLHARYPYIEEPFMVLTTVLTFYMAASEQLDATVPEIPHL
jgi:hypothetical protein